ncbi:amino acid ABC transporter [Desulfosarcina alkanivorans]|uniref:Amino acid ABC transporter n=1 Tax=Desulfosarcina alkanivorans TaxID=571177 RepID=A0A5K7YSQ2_9BACT|nr:branched-chain amino acid ABC transporter permease [Desulfosarcina alkanivorans]BBO71668.1 amino acid ABC transporter [Desulfosarcina alkanivorans]
MKIANDTIENKLGGWRSRLTGIGLNPIGAALLIGLALVPLFVKDEFLLRLLISAMMFGALAVAFDFTAGFINIVNFGFAAFWGMGAYTSGLLVVKLGWSPWMAIPAGALASGVLGVILGLLTIRLGGIFASCMTWFVALAMLSAAGNMVDLTQGHAGMTVPLLFETVQNWPYFYLILAIMLAVYILVTVIIKSNVGMAFRAIGQDTEAAASSGIDAVRYKVMNFTISCLLAGLIGGFYAHFIGILTPTVMHTSHTVEVLAMAYIGGRGTIWGPLVSAMIMVPVMEFMKDLMEYRLILYGALMVFVMTYYPRGMVGIWENIVGYIGKLRKDKRNLSGHAAPVSPS